MAATAREEVVFEAMEEYIWRRYNAVAQFIATRSLMELCEDTEKKTGARVGMQWWEQAGLDLGGERETEAVEIEVEGDGMEK